MSTTSRESVRSHDHGQADCQDRSNCSPAFRPDRGRSLTSASPAQPYTARTTPVASFNSTAPLGGRTAAQPSGNSATTSLPLSLTHFIRQARSIASRTCGTDSYPGGNSIAAGKVTRLSFQSFASPRSRRSVVLETSSPNGLSGRLARWAPLCCRSGKSRLHHDALVLVFRFSWCFAKRRSQERPIYIKHGDAMRNGAIIRAMATASSIFSASGQAGRRAASHVNLRSLRMIFEDAMARAQRQHRYAKVRLTGCARSNVRQIVNTFLDMLAGTSVSIPSWPSA